jgi:NADH-quinone oxidoreductase subunit L
MQLDQMTWLIPVPPLAAFFLIVLFTNRSKGLSHAIALLSIAASWALSWSVFFNVIVLPEFGHEVVEHAIPWLPFGSEEIGTEAFKMGVLVDPLTAVMLFFVPVACGMIFLYSVGYQNWGKPRDPHDKPGEPPHNGIEPLYSRFFAYLSLFAFGMLLLSVADNLLLMFKGWEIMGLCSYLLIGFWYARKYDDPKKITPRQAAVKAFMTTRVADVVMMLGIVYLYSATGTLSFREIMFAEEGHWLKVLSTTPSVIQGLMASHLIGILLLIGTVGKSAQFPLHTWLPDAMEGPTPVSAMIHAAAMVSAGVYAMIRVYPILSAGWVEGGPFTPAMLVLATIGAFTALFAATIAFTQNDVKKVLAYSTISQLGFMLAALGIGAYVAAAFHLMTHAFFKALLFLGSGSIIHGVEHGMHHSPGKGEHAGSPQHSDPPHLDPQDMRYMGGLRDKMPITFVTFVIGGFALAGFPFITAGFWSKDEILLDSFLHAPAVFWTLVIAAFLTAFYTARQIVMVFGGKPRTQAAAHASENTWTMTLPLIILSVFAVSAGWLNIPAAFPGFGPLAANLHIDSWFHEMLGGALVEHPAAAEFAPQPLIASIVVGVGGLLVGWLMYRGAYQTAADRDPMEFLGPVYTFLKNKYYIDEVYDTLFVRPSIWISETVVSAWVDRGVIDGTLHLVARAAFRLGHIFRDDFEKPVINDTPDYMAKGIQLFGREFRFIQTGRVQNYLLAGLGIMLVVGLVLFMR